MKRSWRKCPETKYKTLGKPYPAFPDAVYLAFYGVLHNTYTLWCHFPPLHSSLVSEIPIVKVPKKNRNAIWCTCAMAQSNHQNSFVQLHRPTTKKISAIFLWTVFSRKNTSEGDPHLHDIHLWCFHSFKKSIINQLINQKNYLREDAPHQAAILRWWYIHAIFQLQTGWQKSLKWSVCMRLRISSICTAAQFKSIFDVVWAPQSIKHQCSNGQLATELNR